MISLLSSTSVRSAESRERLRAAEARAEEFLRELDVKRPNDIDPRLFAECLDILVTPARIPGLDGCLLRMGPIGTILYSSEIRHPSRIRFTNAHELGHRLLHPTQSQAFLCTEENVARYKGSEMELEANSFAGALLIPRFLLKGVRLSAEEFLASTLATADGFGVSVMATAKRFLDLTPTPSLAVFSSQGRIRWSWASFGATDVLVRAGTDSSAEALRVGLVENTDEYWFPNDFRRERITVREQSFLLYEDTVMTYMEIRVD